MILRSNGTRVVLFDSFFLVSGGGEDEEVEGVAESHRATIRKELHRVA